MLKTSKNTKNHWRLFPQPRLRFFSRKKTRFFQKLLKTVTIGIATAIDIKKEHTYQILIFLIIFYFTLIINVKKLPLLPKEVNTNSETNLRERLKS